MYRAATGGDVNGASTITQQLARNYYQGLSQKRTVSRKLKEILISVRMGNEKKKDWILEQYLNTVPFGRGAYGVQAASRAYFHKPVKDITVPQAAMLAAMIQRPGYFKSYGPDSDPAKPRMHRYVLLSHSDAGGWLPVSLLNQVTADTIKASVGNFRAHVRRLWPLPAQQPGGGGGPNLK